MEVDMATVGSIVGAAIAALGGREAWARSARRGSSERPPQPSIADMQRQIADLHAIAFSTDGPDGEMLHTTMRRAIRQSAESAVRQEEILERIADGQERLASAVISASRPPGR